jgi:hypothetical protein
MAAIIFLVVTLVAVGVTLPVARERGGLAALFGREPEMPIEESPPPADALAKPDAKTDAPPTPSPSASCPPDTLPIAADDKALTCVEAGEYPGLREVPRVDVTLADARSLCTERGRRLCSIDEWRLACGGASGRAFPYGPQHEREVCNEARSDGTGTNLSRSGARDRCVSPEGAYDLVGNVGEWVDEGVVLGGDATTKTPSCSARHDAAATHKGPSTGLRCCVTVRLR